MVSHVQIWHVTLTTFSLKQRECKPQENNIEGVIPRSKEIQERQLFAQLTPLFQQLLIVADLIYHSL